MGQAEAWAAFPRRPLRVRASGRQRAFIAFSAAMALAAWVGAAWLAVELVPPLLRDASAWETARPVAHGLLKIRCDTERSWLPLARCRATGSWTDLAGRTQPFDETIVTLFGVGDARRPELRVAISPSGSPGSPMLSVFVAELPLRSAAGLILVGGLAGLGGVVLGGAWLLLRDLRAWRALARNPWPVEARLVADRIVANPEWAHEFRFRARLLDAREIETSQRLAVVSGEHGVPPERWTYVRPVRLGGDPARLLALVDDRRARLATETLAPLVLTPEEREAVLRAAAL